METKIQRLLDDVIVKEIENLPTLSAGSKEKSEAVEELTQLYKLKLETAKIEQEKESLEFEKQTRKEQFESQAKDRWVNFGLQVGITVGGWIAYDIWHRRGLRFEETGTITSPYTRNLISRMFPKK